MSHAAYAPRRDRGCDRIPAHRPGCGRLVVAGRRPGAASLLARRGRLRRRPAPWHRCRSLGRRVGAGAGGGSGLVRRRGPGKRPRADDRGWRRLRGDAAPARIRRRRARHDRRRRRRCRPRRRKRRRRHDRAARASRRPRRRRPGRLRRPARAAAGAHGSPCARACAGTDARSESHTGIRLRCASGRGRGSRRCAGCDCGPAGRRRGPGARGVGRRRAGSPGRRRRAPQSGAQHRDTERRDAGPGACSPAAGRRPACCVRLRRRHSPRPGAVGQRAHDRADGRSHQRVPAPPHAGAADRAASADRRCLASRAPRRGPAAEPAFHAAGRDSPAGPCRPGLTPSDAVRQPVSIATAAASARRDRGGRRRARGQGGAKGCAYHGAG